MLKKMAFLTILTSLLGTSAVLLNIRSFHLTLFRGFIIALILLFFIQKLQRGRIYIWDLQKNNGYSGQFFTVWLLYAIISICWVKDYFSWFKNVYFIIIGYMGIMIYSRFLNTSQDILNALRLYIIPIIVHNLIGWYEIITNNYLFLERGSITKYTFYRLPVSMFYNTNDFATFMLFAVFITYVCAVNSENLIKKLVCWIIVVSSILLLIRTMSRANILGLIIAVIMFAYLNISSRTRRTKTILICLGGLIITFFHPYILKRIFPFIKGIITLDFSTSSSSDSIRLNLIKNGLYFLIRTFGFGTGAGNIEHWIENCAIYPTDGITNMHNWWMEILTEFGIIIFGLFTLFYLKLLRDLYKTYKLSTNRIDASLSMGILCCLSGFVIGSVSSSSNFSQEWLWIFLAICVAYQRVCKRKSKELKNQFNSRFCKIQEFLV